MRRVTRVIIGKSSSVKVESLSRMMELKLFLIGLNGASSLVKWFINLHHIEITEDQCIEIYL